MFFCVLVAFLLPSLKRARERVGNVGAVRDALVHLKMLRKELQKHPNVATYLAADSTLRVVLCA